MEKYHIAILVFVGVIPNKCTSMHSSVTASSEVSPVESIVVPPCKKASLGEEAFGFYAVGWRR